MTESTYTSSINKVLRQRGVYAWKIYDPLNGGVPDAWYSGTSADLWAEYKYVQNLPKKAPVKPKLSGQQQDWLAEQHRRGRNVCVIVGSPNGAVIYPGLTWAEPLPVDQLTVLPKQGVIEWILQQTSCSTTQPSSSCPPSPSKTCPTASPKSAKS